MSIKEKCSNPMIGLVIFLVVFIIALLTTVIILRSGDQRITVVEPEKLVAPKVTVGSTVPSPGKSTVGITVPRSRKISTPTVIPPRNVCETPECITLAHQLHNWKDPTVDPCVDFYKFSCGKYSEHTVVDGTRSIKTEQVARRLIKEYLLENKNKPTTSRSENTMKILFNTCEGLKEEESFHKNEKKVFKEIWKDIRKIGSFPLADKDWDESKFNLNDVLTNLARMGETDFGLFQFSTPSVPYLEIKSSSSSSPNAKYLKKAIKEILEENNIDFDEALIEKDYKKYKELSEDLRQHHDDGENEVDISDVEKAVPSINFQKIIENLINPKRKNVVLEKVKKRLLVYDQSLFFDKDYNLEEIIKDTSKRTLANFFIFNYIHSSIFGLSTDLDIAQDTECEEVVIDSLPRATLRVFVRNFFDKENLKMVSEMVEDTKRNFIEILQESTWLHEETKKNAILKVEKVRKMIGYPDEFEKEGALDKVFETIDVLPTDSFYSILNKIRRFTTEQIMEYVAQETPLDPKESWMDANAFYTAENNFLAILAPFIDDPIFDSTYPKYATIAGTGEVLGHELGHGFDVDGVSYDENGVERNWWTPEDTVEYGRRVQCFKDQYNNYDDPIHGKHLDGNITIFEMLADWVGRETSWRGFKKLDLSKEPRLIGYENYSIPKLYFQIAALDYCTPRDTHSLEEILSKVHPIERFRVNGVFSNMKEFAETYNCPVGSPMNPVKKCELF